MICWLEAVGAKPDALQIFVAPAPLVAMVAVTALCFPRKNNPVVGHNMFSGIAAQRDAEERIFTVFNGPTPYVCCTIAVVFGINRIAKIVVVRRIQKYAGQSVFVCHRWPAHARPVARTNPHIP